MRFLSRIFGRKPEPKVRPLEEVVGEFISLLYASPSNFEFFVAADSSFMDVYPLKGRLADEGVSITFRSPSSAGFAEAYISSNATTTVRLQNAAPLVMVAAYWILGVTNENTQIMRHDSGVLHMVRKGA